MLLIGSRPELDAIKVKINKLWKCKSEPANVFVGFQIVRDRSKRTLWIHQEAYTTRLLNKLGMSNRNPRALPIAAGTVLKSTEHDLDRYQEVGEDQAVIYRTIVGSVIYLANCTRPDIAYTVGQLARMMARPNENHLTITKQLLRYLKGTTTLGIEFRPTLIGYDVILWSNATWGTEDNRKSF